MFEMVLSSFKIKDKLKNARFFQKTFLLANLSIKMVLKMLFFIFSNVNMLFAKQELIRRFYIIIKALSTIKQVKIIYKRKFTKMVLDKNVKVFVLHITSLSLN